MFDKRAASEKTVNIHMISCGTLKEMVPQSPYDSWNALRSHLHHYHHCQTHNQTHPQCEKYVRGFRSADGPMALPLARRTMAERYRANSWSFLTGVGPKVVQCGCHASCVSSSPVHVGRDAVRRGVERTVRVRCYAAIKRCRNWFDGWGEIK